MFVLYSSDSTSRIGLYGYGNDVSTRNSVITIYYYEFPLQVVCVVRSARANKNLTESLKKKEIQKN